MNPGCHKHRAIHPYNIRTACLRCLPWVRGAIPVEEKAFVTRQWPDPQEGVG
jgi:hypothetical protein